MAQSQQVVVVLCPDCDETRVPAHAVTVRYCVDNDEWSYWFECPSCERRAAAITWRAGALQAVEAGARFDTWRLPAELSECHDGEPINLVDIAEIQLGLHDSDWRNELSG